MHSPINRGAINNDDYSDGSGDSTMNTAFPTKAKIGSQTPAEKKPFKFLLCIDIQTGFKLIGALEFLSTFFQLMNLMWSVKVGVACLVIFNIPLLCTWIGSTFYKSKGQIE